jgi:hypothetical protein
MLVAAVIQAYTDFPTGKICSLQLKEALNQMLYLIAKCIIKSNA